MPLSNLIKKVFGSRNQRQLKRFGHVVKQINNFEPKLANLSDDELRQRMDSIKASENFESNIDAHLPEVFALVREASKRVLGLRHFDVQMIGGMALHYGQIAEMHTGEGKTLVATLPACLNALTNKGVHVVTVNDYLAKRDAAWMSPVFEFFGMTVGVILSGMDKDEKKAAYDADVTYGTNNEYGFDYLRDNMAFSADEKVQRSHAFAVIDEVDSILIDEARTPLIISGPTEDTSELYRKMDTLIPRLSRQETEEAEGDYFVDEKTKQVHLSEQGHVTVENLLVELGMIEAEDSLYSPANILLLHHLNAALRAHTTLLKDVDYIVREGEVVIVDEHTGRTMIGRRWSDGLHQAVEAKEHVTVRNESQTLASITFQNYFRLYKKLSGMTGTADTEAYEFHQIYNLEVLVIPTNKENKRDDQQDLVFISAKEKFDAIVKDVIEASKRHQPILVGTASIETSEYLSARFKEAKITHQVLNAKFHEYEAQIISEAGRPGAVTIATNMAGRGTDIVLGGNLKAEINALEDPSEAEIAKLEADWQSRHQKVLEAGGLYVVGSERHESRRIDNQLRGRSGRQGDPGATRFYLSLDDDLMRRFAKPGMVAFMRRLHTEEGVPLQSNMLSRGIENAQRKVEGQNFDIRKQLLEFDDVANEQRKVIYEQRDELIHQDSIIDTIEGVREYVVTELVRSHIPENSVDDQWQVEELERQLQSDFHLDCPVQEWLDKDDELDDEGVLQHILKAFESQAQHKEQESGAEVLRNFEKVVMLQSLDTHWKEHLANMDHLRQSIGLRGYAQKDPKQEYKREAFNLFGDMLERFRYHVISTLAKVKIQTENDVEAIEENKRRQAETEQANLTFQHGSVSAMDSDEAEMQPDDTANSLPKIPFTRGEPKLGRNSPCHCGSGKKYKTCHGRLAQ